MNSLLKNKCAFLRGISLFNPYLWVTLLRNRFFDMGWIRSRCFKMPLIVVGNITVGGTGKTPHVEYLISLLKDTYRVAVLSRGYGRKSNGFLLATGNESAASLGDEPFQMKRKFPNVTVAVDGNRCRGISSLMAAGVADVVLLDDAFQHRYVRAGLNIVLVDYSRPLWRDTLLPFGRLRESAAGIARAHVVIVTKSPSSLSLREQQDYRTLLRTSIGVPVFFSKICYGKRVPLFSQSSSCRPLRDLAGSYVLLFTGIARPSPLEEELMDRGCRVELIQFADHHLFTKKELESIAKRYEELREKNKLLLTTEKDAARLCGRDDLPEVMKRCCEVIPVTVEFLNEENQLFNQIIKEYVGKNQGDIGLSER